jgi:hypothetical protein
MSCTWPGTSYVVLFFFFFFFFFSVYMSNSSYRTMHAASTVIDKPIKSVYSVVNGTADMNIKILNTRGTKWHGFQNEPMLLPPDHNSDIMSWSWPTGLECGVQDLDVHVSSAIDNRIMLHLRSDWRHSLNYLTMQRSMSVYMSNISYRTLVHLLPVPFDNVHRLVAIHAHGPCMLPVVLLASLSSLCILSLRVGIVRSHQYWWSNIPPYGV